MGNEAVQALPEKASGDNLKYFVDVYVDDYLAMAVATSQEQLRHVANAVMKGVHDVFPPDEDDSNDRPAELGVTDSLWVTTQKLLLK